MRPFLSYFINQKRTNKITPYLKGAVLDLGCGIPRIINQLAKTQPYTGVDKNSLYIEKLQEKHPNYHFFTADLENNFPTIGQKFDTIILLALLEHLANPAYLFSRIPDLLNINGRMIVTTPSPFGGQVHKFGATMGVFNKNAAKDHKFFFTPKSLMPILVKNNLKISEYRRFMFYCNQIFIITHA